MRERSRQNIIAAAAGLLSACSFAQIGNAQTGIICVADEGVPPIARVDGLSELLGDLALSCTGGTPTPAGQAVPQYSITVFLSTNITSRVVPPPFTEALLIVDEPYSAVNPARPLLNCGNSGAPDSGTSGPGICSILSSGSSDATYDGTANGWGTQSCDGQAGRPASNTYGCGRPNVFQGKLGTASDPNQKNAITFFSVPLDPPASGGNRTLRITNLRGNAAAVGLGGAPGSVNSITTYLTISGSPSILINNPNQLIAYIESGLGQNCGSAGAGTRVRFCEQFGSSFRPKDISFYTGDHGGIPGNATLLRGQSYPSFNGGTKYPTDVAQNVVGAIYNTESGFEWLNNSTSAPPSPNPPFGIGTSQITATGNPLKSTGAGGLDTGIGNAGVADAGTRIAFQFSSLPQGASIQIPDVLYLFPIGATYSGDPTQYQSSATGVMVRTASDAAGAGPFSQTTGTLTAPSSLAVYEVLWADPFSTEFTELPYTILNAPPGTNVQVSTKFAPFYRSASAGGPSSAYSVPRFTNGSCSVLDCVVVSPNIGSNTAPPLSVTFTVDPASGFSLANAQVVLRAAGLKDISGAPTSSSATMLTATFDLSGAGTGYQDVIITPQTGPEVTLPHAFFVNNVPACTFGISTSGLSVAAAGAMIDIYVTPNPAACAWTASTNASWITVGQPLQFISDWDQPITVAPNPTNNQRTATLTIAGITVPLVQAPNGQSCSYDVEPPVVTVPALGGVAAFTVNTLAGCAWSDTFNIPWINGSSGGTTPGAGAGPGFFDYFVDANPGPARSASPTLAGQPVTINQLGGTRVGIFRLGFFWLEDMDGNKQFNDPPDRAFAFGGVPGDIPITGDWNGSGTNKVGVYRPSNGLFILDYDGDGQFTAADKAYDLGIGVQVGDIPVVGDWNGDGRTKVGLFRQGFFWILDYNGNGVFEQGADKTYAFGGVAGDVPVVGDWTGTGTSKIGLLREGFFWILDANGDGAIDSVNETGGDQAFAFGGIQGDVPVVGDWNGSGTSKVGVFRSGFFWVLDANGNHISSMEPDQTRTWHSRLEVSLGTSLSLENGDSPGSSKDFYENFR